MLKIFGSMLCAIVFIASVTAQITARSELLKTWKFGFEDWYEFVYGPFSAVESNLRVDPNGKLVARICTKDKFPDALVNSTGNALAINKSLMDFYGIPMNKVYFATSSKCLKTASKPTEEYWYMPDNQEIEFDEILPAEDVSVKMFPASASEPKNFKKYTENIKTFVQALKNDLTATGYIIEFSKTNELRHRSVVIKALRKEKINAGRVKFVRNLRNYQNYFPHLTTVSIKE